MIVEAAKVEHVVLVGVYWVAAAGMLVAVSVEVL